MSEHNRLSTRNTKIAAMLADGGQIKNFYRFIAQNPYINLHDACQIVLERPDATVCNTMEDWNAMGRRVTKGKKGIPYYDRDGYKHFVFDASDTHGDDRFQRDIIPLKHILIGLDELNGTSFYEDGRGEYRKLHGGVYSYLERQGELTGDEQRDALLVEGVTFLLYSKTGFPKTSGIHLHGLPYSYRDNADFVKELYIRSNILTQEIEEAYENKQSEVEVIDDTEEETITDEPAITPDEQAKEMSEEHSESTISPLYQKYLDAQKINPQEIVVMRVGDFYEVMGENAVKVAEELDLTLTGRNVGLPERVPMCGFPYYASEKYIEKVLERHGVILAEEEQEPKYILSHAEANASVNQMPNLIEIPDEHSPFDDDKFEETEDDEQEEEWDDFDDEDIDEDFDDEPEQDETEEEQVKSTPKKDEKGIQDRKRKNKPQLSMFDLLEPQGKSEKDAFIDECLTREYSGNKVKFYDEYRKNLTLTEFAKLLKDTYGTGGSFGGELDKDYNAKGISYSRRDRQNPDNNLSVHLKWPEVAEHIAELIESDEYLSQSEKNEYACIVRFRNEREAAKTDGERCEVIANQIVEYGTKNTYSKTFSEYPHFLEDYAQFYFDHSEEIKQKLLTRKEVVAVGEQSDMFDRYLHVDFHIRYCPRWQANLRNRLNKIHAVQDFADSFIWECTDKFNPADHSETITYTVTPEDIGESNYLFIKDYREEFADYLRAKPGVESVDFSMQKTDIVFKSSYIRDLITGDELRPAEHTKGVREIADKVIKEGTENTTSGSWMAYFEEFGDEELFITNNSDEIVNELYNHQEVAEADVADDGFNMTFYLDYCPNIEEREEELSTPEQREEDNKVKVGDKYSLNGREWEVKGFDGLYPEQAVITRTERSGDLVYDVTQNMDIAELLSKGQRKKYEQGENTDLSAVLEQTELGGAKTRFRSNVAAIRLVNKLYSENRNPTAEERKTLSRFVGWGGLAQAFDEKNESWKKEYEELKSLLSVEDYEQARSSTLNAYYTAKDVIDGIYSALNRFGVKGNNRILEPAMGTGNFFGFMPREIADGSRLYGVELDNLTGRIAAKLYPQANVQIKGFEDTTFPDDKFDIVVGNVPFGGYGVADPDYNRYNFKVHDYFLAKSIDKVRPGGIVAIVTSKGTMDKLNPSARKYVAERAELLGAIRLPNNAFKQTAGTEAVADILFFRKRAEKITDLSKEEWLGTGKTAEGYEINNYFISHPQMILGTLAEEHGLYGGIDITVKPDGRKLKDAFAEAVKNLPESFYINPETPPIEEQTTEVDYNVKPFCYKAENGRLYMRVGEGMEEQPIPKSPKDAYQRICGMIALRDGLHHILDIQIKGCSDEVLEREQWKLNSRYDLFVKKYGYLNSQTNTKLFKDDGDSALLFAAENINEETKAVTKADIFFKRTIRPYVVPTSTDDPFEALQISKNERGKVDIAYIEELTGKDYDAVLSELGTAVFRDPEQVKAGDKYSGFVTNEEYLSGQVVNKLELARSVAEEHPEYRKNVEALEGVQPEKLTASDISVRLGATWVDSKYYKQFYLELLGVYRYLYDDVELTYNPHDSSWRLDQTQNVRYTTQMKQKEVYGTNRAPAYRLFVDALNLKATTITDLVEENGKEKRVVNQAETIAAREKQNRIKEAFADWIFKDPERRADLEETYNRLFNQTRLPSYDGSYLKFPEMNPAIELKPHQKNAVHRIITSPSSTLLHHVVGAGKTFTVIASTMKMRQLGLCKKAMVTCPNHLVQQWAGEWRKLYPNAHILVATKEDLEKNNRKKFVSKVALGDWDGIIIAQSSFAKIPISTERQIHKLREEIEGVEATIVKQWEENGMPRGAVKNLETIKKSKEKQLKKLMDASGKDDVLKFEDLGIDYLFVDEAHAYKNLFLFTKMNNVAGISTAASQRASDLKLKCEYLQELHGSDRGVVFATGTPISNSMTEMYTMQTYLQPSVLKKLGMTFFDGWAADFGETITSMELSPSGQGYRARTRFAKFTNLPELLKLYRAFADVQTADMVKLNVPKAERQVITLKPSDTVIELAEEIAERADRIHDGNVDPHEDNMLKITSDGKKLALDPRCFVPESQDEEGSKLNECAERIYEVWTDTADIKGTQIVFCDLSTPKVKFEDYEYGKDFDAYNDLKYKLVQRGIPAREIAYIHEANTDEQKQALFDRVNSGAVRVLVGSTEKCGAGTNVQKRLVALHHLDTPYRPSDMEQREGRIIRQGNTNEKVKIFTYVTERTFDSYSYQILENKQRFISQINRGDLTIREAEDIDETALSYAEIKAITAANPKIKRKMEVDAEVARLRVLEGQYRKNLYALQDKIYKTYPEEIRKQELYIERIGKDLEMLKSTRPADPEEFSISVNGKVYKDKKEGGKALMDALHSGKVNIPVAEYCGFKISMNPMYMLGGEREITLAAEGQYVIPIGDSAFGTLTRLENFLSDLPDREARLKKRSAQLNADLEVAKEQAEKPFEQAEQLKTLLSEQAQLNAELNLDKRDDVIVADENDSGDGDNNFMALPEITRRNMEVNIIDEDDKVAAMKVELLPDYAVTNEDMHAYGYTWDGMLPLTGTAAKTISKLGVTVYELTPTDNEYEVKATELFDEKDKLFGVEKPDWNAFIQTDKGRDYIAARREVVKSVLTSLDSEDMQYFSNTERERLWEQYGTEAPALDKALGERGIPSNNILKRYAVPVFDEQVEKLKAELPFEEHGWSEADIHYAVFGNVEPEELKDVLFRHSYEVRLNNFLDKELAEVKYLNGRTTGFTEDEIFDLCDDLKVSFDGSEFAENMTGADFDYWYDGFEEDELLPLLNKRALPGEKYMPQYEDNPLGLPPMDDELTVLAVQPDIEMDENRTIKGAALLKNAVMDGWYVIGFTHDSESSALSVGDRTNLEKLGVSPVEIDPNIIRTFDSEQEARSFYDERVKVLNSLKENYYREEPDYEAEVRKSVNAEFETYKADVLARSPEEIFYENYKIHVFTELKEVIEDKAYLEPEHYRALYQERGSILHELYDDYLGEEYASVNSGTETAEFIRDYCGHYHPAVMSGNTKMPVYLKTSHYALEHNEFGQYQASRNLSEECRNAIDKAISENYDGMHLRSGFEMKLIDEYGEERVRYIFATTLRENLGDGRYSPENKGWAENIPVSESPEERRNCCLNSHPAVIDGVVRLIRKYEQLNKNVEEIMQYQTNAEQQNQEENSLAENKFLTQTSRGDKVLSIAQDRSGRNVAVVQRKSDYTVAIGYDTTAGTWAQGVYDFKDEKAANDYREKYYGENSEPQEKWYEIFVSKDALIKRYNKSSLMRMPSSNKEYADYSYYVFNNRIKESRQIVDMQSDSRELCYKITLSEGEVVNLRNRDGDEVELTAGEYAGLVNHTSDKDYEREEKPRVSVNIPRDALIKEYENSSLYRAPNGTKYAGYAYYLPNSVVRENAQAEDGSMMANIAEDFTVTLRKDKEEIKISAQEFKELVGGTADEDYKREPTAMDEYREQQKDDDRAWSEIALSEKAVIAAYDKNTLIRMPKGKYEGMVYYIPSGMVRREENGLRLRLPEDFEVHLKGGSDEKTDLTAQQLMDELAGKSDEDYESIYRRPSEEAKKKFEEIETNLRSSLPDEMRNKPNWVVVRTRENKDTGTLEKFLIDVHTGKFAESDNPKTWTDFDTACKYAKEHGGVALAYALDGKDGIACIDLDKCISDDGKRSALAEEVLVKCGKTYIEHSLSGKGLHIFGRTKGADLRSFSKDGDMEYYQGGQFIAMTGDGAGFYRLGDFDTPEMKALLERKLERRTEWKNVGKGEAGLTQMDDRELLEKAFSAKNGDTVKRLYNGEDLRHNHSNSDMSLMNYLAFYSGGNVEQMTRIFATSGLYRPEKPASYYEHTAIKAAKDTPHYTPPKAPAQPPKSASSGNTK
ncbi:MAG TPA: DUF3849 domain-containing protein [Candidatus Coproplasma stercoravium]|nr:DUF3849 domain-containing protein [Candidatus Coproplasma stercoravium]